jgi:hypothetical protein
MLEACVRSGDARSGLVVADRALASMGPDHLWEAEIRRLRAEFLAALGASADEAEAELDRALIVARRQGARMLELRIAATILRHRLRNGDRPGACSIRDLLMSLIQELPEARDSDEVRDAATLIAQS